MKKPTVSQIFQLGSIVIVWGTAIITLVPGIDIPLILKASAATLTAWSGIGAVLTGQTQEAQSVASRIDDPSVKRTVLPAVANLAGLEPLQPNRQADAVLTELGNDSNFKKILPPR